MKASKLKYLLFSFPLWFAQAVQADWVEWSASSISLLTGDGFEVESDRQHTVTLEHVSGWSFGDLFMFADIIRFSNSRLKDTFYGEFSPRISLVKTGVIEKPGSVIKDVLVSATLEFGKGDVETFLIGPAIDLDVDGFDYLQMNLYKRFPSQGRDGHTVQFTPVWGMTFPVGSSNLHFEGYMDWNIDSDDTYNSNLHFNPRLRYDFGRLMGMEDRRLLGGIEYSYWKNKYGIRDSSVFDTDQSAVNLILSVQF